MALTKRKGLWICPIGGMTFRIVVLSHNSFSIRVRGGYGARLPAARGALAATHC